MKPSLTAWSLVVQVFSTQLAPAATDLTSASMPSLTHELLLTLFRNRPELAAELLREALGLELPRYTEVRLDSVELSQAVPTAYTADLVVLLVDDRPVLGIVVEAQLGRDDRKHLSWPVYVASLRARIGCQSSCSSSLPTKRWRAGRPRRSSSVDNPWWSHS